jgi:hypothetical protein
MKKNIVLILILSTNDKEFEKFKKSITATWYNNAKKRGIRCIFYSGGNEVDELIDDDLKLNCDDSIIGSSKKLHKALKFIDESNIEYTHIYRTNLSSFLFIDDFIKFSDNLNHTFYGGVKLYYNHLGIIENYRKLTILIKLLYNQIKIIDKIKIIKKIGLEILKFRIIEYASGAGFYISKDLVKLIINEKNINYKLIDDVMIGEILHKQNIIDMSRYDILNKIHYANMDEKCFHVRLKTNNRNNDANKMYHLNTFLNFKDFILMESNI